MMLSAKELGAINVTLSTHAPEAGDREVAKEVFLMLKTHIDAASDRFVDGEIELNTQQKAFLLKLIPSVPWLTPQLVDFVDPLILKLSI